MLLKWWRQHLRDRNIETIYGVIVAQARQPVFYSQYGVPDTVEGRFDMIVLHLFLYIHRARDARLAHRLFDRFCADLDGNLREMGVGDLSVPKRMRKFAEAFYGRLAVYEKALGAGDAEAIAAAIARNVFGRDQAEVARALVGYVVESAAALEKVGDAALARGEFAFAPPSFVSVGAAADVSYA